MGHNNCCVVNCTNTGRNNSAVKYYRFPTARHRLLQRHKWIAAVRRVNSDGSSWSPKASERICSAHFVNNKKSAEQCSPSFSPTILPPIYKSKVVNQISASNRHQRFMNRRTLKRTLVDQITPKEATQICTNVESSDIDIKIEHLEYEKTVRDQECEARFLVESNHPSETFVCNRYVCEDASCVTCEVETQTDIVEITAPIKIPNRKRFRDAECCTVQKTYEDKLVGPNFGTQESKTRHFSGIDGVKDDEQLLDLAGVTFENFTFLLERFDTSLAKNSKVSKENRLLICLTKLKTGLTFSALSVIFGIHRTEVSKIFYSTVRHLARTTAKCVHWPDKRDVIKTMPECFRENYSNARVIINRTEFRIETPSRVDDRVLTYSHYEKGFTAKLLVGMTPSGFISFKSKVAAGRKSDSQITIESGLIDLLEDYDVVLAYKSFPQFQNVLDERGSKALLIVPPFLEKNSEFTEKQTQETYKVAKCCIHVERVTQRMRTYLILDKITHDLFECIDDIVHIICVLVNLHPPIYKI